MKATRAIAAILVALAGTGIAAMCSVAFGARIVSASEVWTGVSHIFTPDSLAASGDIAAIAVNERIPRTVIALCVGAALGVSGALMQAITRNPIADPGILGINYGASLAVAIGIFFFTTSDIHSTLWLALIGASLTALLVYTIGSLGPGGTTPIKLALAGVATTAVLSSAVTALRLPNSQGVDEFRYWTVGSLGRGTWQTLGAVTPLLIGALLLALLLAPSLNSLALGDDTATGLGVNVARTRILSAIAGVGLCATATAVAGPIGFVGLVVPHILRTVVTVDLRWLIPLSALGGAILLTVADTLGRVLGRPNEISVGLITAFVGAPVLIAIVRNSKVRDL